MSLYCHAFRAACQEHLQKHLLCTLYLHAQLLVLWPRELCRSNWSVTGSVGLQVLGDGDLAFKLTIKAAKFSTSAKEKIQAAGGEAVEVPQKAKWTRALHKRKVAAAAAAAPKKAPAPKPITKKAVKQ